MAKRKPNRIMFAIEIKEAVVVDQGGAWYKIKVQSADANNAPTVLELPKLFREREAMVAAADWLARAGATLLLEAPTDEAVVPANVHGGDPSKVS